jgi:hypothetical protein
MITVLGGSPLISDVKQIVRFRSGVDPPLDRSKIGTGPVERAAATGQTQMSAVAEATTSAARFVVRMNFETTALLSRRAFEPEMFDLPTARPRTLPTAILPQTPKGHPIVHFA